MIPFADFIKSGDDALFTYITRFNQAQYHEAFKNNLVGLNLFLLDVSTGMDEFPRAHLIVQNRIPGYPQTEPFTQSISAWARFKPMLSFTPSVRQLMFVDKDVEFKFQPKGQRLEISGAPYWILLRKKTDGSGEIVGELKDTQLARSTNPVIYDSIYRIAKYASFFRYLKKSCSADWGAFLSDLAAKRASLANALIPEELMPVRSR